MKRVLRTIEGPFRGSVFVLGRRTTIGRAADADIQVVHEGVSRHHVKLTVQDDAVELLDLDSDNGTLVAGRPVHRCRLLAGDEIRLVGACFRYEELPATSDVETSSAFDLKQTTRSTLCGTVQMRAVGDLPTAPRATPAESEVYGQREPLDSAFVGPKPRVANRSTTFGRALQTRRAREQPPASAPCAPRPVEVHNPVRPTAMVMRPPRPGLAPSDLEEVEHEGDDVALVQDVLRYRTLRLRALRGDPLDAEQQRTYRTLETRLQRDSVGATHLRALRRFYRFPVQVGARLSAELDEPIGMPVSLQDIGAGGVRLGSAIGYRSGEIVMLALDLPELRVVIRSRVAWTDEAAGHVGLAFAGAPTPVNAD